MEMATIKCRDLLKIIVEEENIIMIRFYKSFVGNLFTRICIASGLTLLKL